MPNLPTIISAFAVALVAAHPIAFFTDGCFTYKDPVPNTEYLRNDGGALTPPQKECVEKAIGMIKSMGRSLGGTDGDPPSQGVSGGGGITVDGGSGYLSDYLTERLAKGDICVEKGTAKNDPKVGATASRDLPNFAKHPGINIRPDIINCKKSGGALDNEKAFKLAMSLIHESSHLTNPNDAANSADEFEVPAYQYSAQTLCAALDGDCISNLTSDPNEMTELEKAACDYIKQPNAKICKGGGVQVDCQYCKDAYGIDVKTDPCPPVSPPPPPPIEGAPGLVSGTTSWEETAFSWGIGWASATATLVPWDEVLTISANGDLGRQSVSIPLSTIDGDAVRPVSMCIMAPRSLVVGLHMNGTASSKVIRIDFDNDDVGIPYSITTLYSGAGAAWPRSLHVNQDANAVVFIFDEHTHSAHALKVITSALLTVATPADSSHLMSCKYISSGPSIYTDPISGIPHSARAVVCGTEPSMNPIYTTNVYFFDVDNDLMVDYVELSQ